MSYHRPLSLFCDQFADFDSADVFARGGILEAALAGDFLEGKARMGLNQLQDSDAVLMGKGFGYLCQLRQGAGFDRGRHEGFNWKNFKGMRLKMEKYENTGSALSQAENVVGSDILTIHGKSKGWSKVEIDTAIHGKRKSAEGEGVWDE